MSVTHTYTQLFERAWKQTPKPTVTEIPVNRAELLGRASSYSGTNERIAKWTSATNLCWRAVRDAHTGHSIHVVSDRAFGELTRELTLGLKIMNFMSGTQRGLRLRSQTVSGTQRGLRYPITWYWWDHDWPRILPPNTKPAQEHINGGWTVIGSRNPEVHVYRREEAHKVLIHECIHALQMDVPQSTVDPVRKRIETELLGGGKLWPHLGEAYTEVYAEFLWCIVSGRSWESQVACSEAQAADVWARIRPSVSASDSGSGSGSGSGSSSVYSEDTSVFAYYILKWVLMDPAHFDCVLLSPNASVRYWFSWLRSALDRLPAPSTARTAISLGMTCATSGH